MLQYPISKGVSMSIPQYLHNKYGFADNAKVPTSFLEEELHLEPMETKALVKSVLKRRSYPSMITFAVFVLVYSQYLERNTF